MPVESNRRKQFEKPVPDSQTLWRVAVYIRLSREDGSEESESVVNQQKILTEYLARSFTGRYTVAGTYIDDGLSGTDDMRAEFMRMIADIERGEINCVLCKTLSRAFRNYADQGYYLEVWFPRKQVRFVCAGDPPVDTFTHPEVLTGLEVPITGLMNDRYAAKTSADVRRTFDTKRRSGEFIGAFPPYGYLKHPDDRNKLVPDTDIVPVKRDMMSWILREGLSLSGVAKRLNERGVPNPTAYKQRKGWRYRHPSGDQNDGLWSGSTVRRVLLDPVNRGHLVQGRQRVVSYKVHDKVSVPPGQWFWSEKTHEPTFSQEEADTLESLLSRRTRTSNGSRQVHLFAGLLRCHDCGKAMQRKSAKGHVYYACRSYTEKAGCVPRSVREDRLEAAVLAAIQSQIARVDGWEELLDEATRTPPDTRRFDKALADARLTVQKAQRLSDGLYVDWKNGDIDRETYQRLKAKFTEQAARHQSAVACLIEERSALTDKGTENETLAALRRDRNILRLNHHLLTELVDKVTVHQNGALTVAFRFVEQSCPSCEFSP